MKKYLIPLIITGAIVLVAISSGVTYFIAKGASKAETSNAQTTVTAPMNQNSSPVSNVKDDQSTPPVKKSTSGLCHAQGTTYYTNTTNFTPYNTIDECLASGGKLPKK